MLIHLFAVISYLSNTEYIVSFATVLYVVFVSSSRLCPTSLVVHANISRSIQWASGSLIGWLSVGDRSVMGWPSLGFQLVSFFLF